LSTLVISGLRAGIGGREILHGIDLVVASGEVHAVMGPNGAGKSTLGNVLLGHPGYEVLAGSVTLDGIELLGLPTWQRAAAGLHLAPQDPTELPGVRLVDILLGSTRVDATREEIASRILVEASLVGVSGDILDRALNSDASGGEKKRLETLQVALLRPRIAVLDELDSGLDIDALREIAHYVEGLVHPHVPDAETIGLLAITHYRRLLDVLRPDAVHVLAAGRIVESGGAELVDELEREGYSRFVEETPAAEVALPF
jgi:Fe-S cluster assembly ATP-binding protein